MRIKTLYEQEKLTPREDIVLEYLVLGLDNESIAKEMKISVHTVKTHVSNIIKKFHAKNRVHVAFIAGAGGVVGVQ